MGCPICRKPMLDLPVPVESREVRLDVCKRCQFIWFDPKELEQLPSRPRLPSEKERLPEKVREQTAMFDIESVARREPLDELSMQFLLAGLQLSGASNISALAHLGGAAVGVVFWLACREK